MSDSQNKISGYPLSSSTEDSSKKHASLEQIADLFQVLALAAPEDRARLKQGFTEEDWKDMESIASFAGVFSGVEGNISLRRGELGELFRSIIALQDRATETVYVDVAS